MNVFPGRLHAPLARCLGTAFLCLAAIAGCAKSPTVVNVQVDVDTTVPPLMLLQSSIALVADPDTKVPAEIVSRYPSDADCPGAFVFPMLFPVDVPSGWAGDVVIVVDGLSWDNGKVVATGTNLATATREKTTHATVTLAGVPGGVGPDGGASDDAGSPDARD